MTKFVPLMGSRIVAIALATACSTIALTPKATAQDSPAEMILKSTGEVVWVAISGTAVFIYNTTGELIQTLYPASLENLTKEECWQVKGATGWQEYKKQARIPKRQRLGTCYYED